MKRRAPLLLVLLPGPLLACRGSDVASPQPEKPGREARPDRVPLEPRPAPAPASVETSIARSRSLIEQKKLSAALRCLQDAIDQLQATEDGLPPEQTLASWREIADLACRARDFEKESVARRRVLEFLSPRLEPEDLELVAAMVGLAEARAASGDHAQARALLDEALAAGAPALPETAELLLRARHALACTLLVLGEPLAAGFEIEPVLAERVDALAPDDSLLQRTRLDAAQIRRANGDLEGARLLLEEVLARGSAGLAQSETVAAQVELAETRIEIASPEEVRSLLAQLRSEPALVRLEADDPLYRRLTLVGTRLEELEELDPTLDAAASPELPMPTEAALRAGLRHQRLLASIRRLRPRDPVGSSMELKPSTFAPGQELLQGWPNVASPPGLDVLPRAAQDAARYVPGLFRTAPTWAYGLPGELEGKVAASIAAARTATTLYEALTERSRQIEYMEQDLPADDPRLFDARLQFAQEAWGLEGPALSLETLDDLLEQGSATREPDDPALVEAKWQLALTKHELGDLEGAQPLLVEVLGAREALLERLHPELHATLATLAWNEVELGLTHEARGHVIRLLERLRERVRDSWCLAPREAREAAYVELRRLADAFSLVDALDSLEVFERDVFAMLESLRLLSTPLPPALASTPDVLAKRREAGRLRAELADLCQGVPADSYDARKWSKRVQSIQAQLDRLGQEILGADTTREGLLRRVKVDPLQAALPAESAYVAFWHNVRTFPRKRGSSAPVLPEARYTAFVVRAGAFERVDLGASQALKELTSGFRGAILSSSSDGRGVSIVDAPAPEPSGPAQGLRASLIEPLLPHLAGVRTLHLCLDDTLHLIPLEALTLEDDTLFGERFDVLHELSLARLLAPEPPRRERTGVLTLCGGIDFDAEPSERAVELVTAPLAERSAGQPGFAPLEGTRREVEALAALYAHTRGGEVRLLTGAAVSKPALRERVEGAEHVHLATHGWFASEGLPSHGDDAPGTRTLVRGFAPMVLCGLALAGANHGADERGRVPGILTAEELAGFDLSSAQLVVLSACETGLGLRRHGQGVQSLQAALLAAGAQSTLTSLWKVGDDATATFMELFYRALWQDGASKAEALRHARRELRDRGFPPRDWAAWVLYGDPR